MARWLACVLVVIVAGHRAVGQTGPATLEKDVQSSRALQQRLEVRIDTVPFTEEMPLVSFLEQLAKTGKLTLAVDREAFGNAAETVANTPVRLPPVPRKMTVGTALRLALAQLNADATYRVDPSTVTVTTRRERAAGRLHAADYDISALVDRAPEGQRAVRARQIVQAVVAGCEHLPDRAPPSAQPTLQLRNNWKLIVRAPALGHAEVRDVLAALRRQADVAVIVRARLYEVDDAFYTRLRKAKHLSLDELEQRLLAGQPPQDRLFKQLAKEKPLQRGDERRADDGAAVALLSRYDAISCLPSPADARRDNAPRQAVFEGAAFTATVTVSSDRRSVRLQLTEKASQIEARHKVRVENRDAEMMLVKETAVTQPLDLPDGGAILVAVQYRPAALAAQQRWWVLWLTARIHIEEEERQLRKDPTTPTVRSR